MRTWAGKHLMIHITHTNIYDCVETNFMVALKWFNPAKVFGEFKTSHRQTLSHVKQLPRNLLRFRIKPFSIVCAKIILVYGWYTITVMLRLYCFHEEKHKSQGIVVFLVQRFMRCFRLHRQPNQLFDTLFPFSYEF